ncbi:hypothetical protein [Aureimonas phyllosphaerae]|uniref:Uncharacterized protein n=1 Tax=Aureimonas phyllosphaerae TaxID=1166078 RepID=A0A7W6BZF3_9HYPH|nr:hypothetical protein [Aureimonas phyllosphaerae]MBB3936551.1 hypothetical protein [Aureimonas phyllosphaerae]MBB3960585.1 hypothetical protein [Aureimonas phyllosphaerae]SFF57866.1 hypothetical protein SAMN05216566_1358 [Aureimonas phyllosphaerae]
MAEPLPALPVLMRGPEIVAMKVAAELTGLSTKTLTRWCVSDGIGRRSSKAAPWEISVIALEAKRSGDQAALEALRRGDFGSPLVRRYVDHLGLDL